MKFDMISNPIGSDWIRSSLETSNSSNNQRNTCIWYMLWFKTECPCVCTYICTYIRHRISSQTENSNDVKIAHAILLVISRSTVLFLTFKISIYLWNISDAIESSIVDQKIASRMTNSHVILVVISRSTVLLSIFNIQLLTIILTNGLHFPNGEQCRVEVYTCHSGLHFIFNF
jgi:hypothetical protein